MVAAQLTVRTALSNAPSGERDAVAHGEMEERELRIYGRILVGISNDDAGGFLDRVTHGLNRARVATKSAWLMNWVVMLIGYRVGLCYICWFVASCTGIYRLGGRLFDRSLCM